MKSPTQFAWSVLAMGEYPPRRPYATSDVCWLCGGQTSGRGWPRDEALPVTFASHNAAACQSSDAICEACAAFARGDTWHRYVLERRPALKNWNQASWRSYGHFFSAPDRHECPTPSRWRDILVAPPAPPFLAIISLSGQKNLIFRGQIAWNRDVFPVLVEEDCVYLDRSRFSSCLWDIERALVAGLTREGIRTGRHNATSALKIGITQFEEIERNLAGWRRDAGLFALALYCARRSA